MTNWDTNWDFSIVVNQDIPEWLSKVADILIEKGANHYPWEILWDNCKNNEALANILKQKNITSEALTSRTDSKSIKLIREFYDSGKIDVIICSSVLFTLGLVRAHQFQFVIEEPTPGTATVSGKFIKLQDFNDFEYWHTIDEVFYYKKQEKPLIVKVWDKNLNKMVDKTIQPPPRLVVKYATQEGKTIKEYVPLEDNQQRYFNTGEWINKHFINDSLLDIKPSEIKVEDILSGRVKLRKPRRISTHFVKGYEKIKNIEF